MCVAAQRKALSRLVTAGYMSVTPEIWYHHLCHRGTPPFYQPQLYQIADRYDMNRRLTYLEKCIYEFINFTQI